MAVRGSPCRGSIMVRRMKTFAVEIKSHVGGLEHEDKVSKDSSGYSQYASVLLVSG